MATLASAHQMVGHSICINSLYHVLCYPSSLSNLPLEGERTEGGGGGCRGRGGGLSSDQVNSR